MSASLSAGSYVLLAGVAQEKQPLSGKSSCHSFQTNFGGSHCRPKSKLPTVTTPPRILIPTTKFPRHRSRERLTSKEPNTSVMSFWWTNQFWEKHPARILRFTSVPLMISARFLRNQSWLAKGDWDPVPSALTQARANAKGAAAP